MKKCLSGLENLEAFTETLQLIAEPHRLRILCLLAQYCEKHPNGYCVSELVDYFQEPQNLISHHLGMLKRAQLVIAQRSGKHIRYQLNTEVHNQLKQALTLVFHLE